MSELLVQWQNRLLPERRSQTLNLAAAAGDDGQRLDADAGVPGGVSACGSVGSVKGCSATS